MGRLPRPSRASRRIRQSGIDLIASVPGESIDPVTIQTFHLFRLGPNRDRSRRNLFAATRSRQPALSCARFQNRVLLPAQPVAILFMPNHSEFRCAICSPNSKPPMRRARTTSLTESIRTPEATSALPSEFRTQSSNSRDVSSVSSS